MDKYSSYKPSGIEWLETIPENWKVSKLKYLGNLFGGLTGKSGVDFNNDENPKNKPYIPYTNIFNNTYISKDHFHYVSIDDGESQNRVKKYDMFFLMSSETHKDLGKSCILIDDVDELYLNSFCKGYRIKEKNIQPLFLNYQILGDLHREMISVEGKGFTRINLRQDKINDLIVFYPPLQEQEQIVNYLDEKTTIIDKLISTKQKKVELLKEQRTTLINQVITKGLNPNVKMKDSGVEWIGEIPENWSFVKLGHYTMIVRGGSPRPSGDPLYFDGDFIPWITVGELTNSVGKYITHTETMLTEDGMKQSRIIEVDTLLLSNSGATLGVPKITKIKGCINDGSVGFVKIYSKLSKDYLYHFLTTQTKLLREQQSGYGQPNLNIEIVSNIRLPLPSIQEQEQIVQYLDKQTKEIDELVSMEQNMIELLKEYRQSLISEVITGKIKVI